MKLSTNLLLQVICCLIGATLIVFELHHSPSKTQLLRSASGKTDTSQNAAVDRLKEQSLPAAQQGRVYQ
jgi:hypothetical protein